MIADYEPKERKPLLLKGYSIKDHHYDHYDNYDAINVDRAVDIPIDYDGVIGVPITILSYLWPDGLIHCVYANETMPKNGRMGNFFHQNTIKFNSYSLYCTQFEIVDINPHFYSIIEQGLPKPKQLTLHNVGRKDPYARILIKKLS